MAASNWTNPSHPSSSGLGRAPAASSPPSTAGARPVESPRGQSPTGAGLNFGDAMMLGSSTSGQPAYRVRSTVPSASGRGGLDKPFLGPDDDGTPTTEMRPLRQSNASAVGRTRTDSQKAGALYRGAQAGVLVLADLPDPLRQALSEFDFNGDGTVDAPEIYAAGRRHRASRSQKPQYQLDAFPEALHGALKAFDTDGDGSVSAAELAQAAQLYEEAKNTQKKLWRTVFGLMGMLVLLFAALLGLVILAIELSKETETQGSGVMTVKGSTNPVQTAQQLVEVPLGALPHLGMKFLQKVDAIVAQNKHTGDVYRLTVAEGDISKNTTGALATLYTSRGMVAKVMDLLHVRIYTDVKNDKWFPVCGPCSKCSGLSVVLDSQQQAALDQYLASAQKEIELEKTSPCGIPDGAAGAAGRRLHPLEVHARLPCGDRCFGPLGGGPGGGQDTSTGISFCHTREDHRPKTIKATVENGLINLMVHRSSSNLYKGCTWYREGSEWTVMVNSQTDSFKYSIKGSGAAELVGCTPDPFGPFADPTFMENLPYGQIGDEAEVAQSAVELEDMVVADGDFEMWRYDVPAKVLAVCRQEFPDEKACGEATDAFGIEEMVDVDNSDGQDLTSAIALEFNDRAALAAHQENEAMLYRLHAAAREERIRTRRAQVQAATVAACSSKADAGEKTGVVLFPPGTWKRYCSFGPTNTPCWAFTGIPTRPQFSGDPACNESYEPVCKQYIYPYGFGGNSGWMYINDDRWLVKWPAAEEVREARFSATGKQYVCGWPPGATVSIFHSKEFVPANVRVSGCEVKHCDGVEMPAVGTPDPAKTCANNTCCYQNRKAWKVQTIQCPTDDGYLTGNLNPQTYCSKCLMERDPKIKRCSECVDDAVSRFLTLNPKNVDTDNPEPNFWLQKDTSFENTSYPTQGPSRPPSAAPSTAPSLAPAGPSLSPSTAPPSVSPSTSPPSESPVPRDKPQCGGDATPSELWKIALAAYGKIPGRSTSTYPPTGWRSKVLRCVSDEYKIRVEFTHRPSSQARPGSLVVAFAKTDPLDLRDVYKHDWQRPQELSLHKDLGGGKAFLHGGFVAMAASVKECVEDALELLGQPGDCSPDYIVGHGIGGAVATVFAELYHPGARRGVHTFGAPPTRWDKKAYQGKYHCQTGQKDALAGKRYFITDDPVASDWVGGHTGTYWINWWEKFKFLLVGLNRYYHDVEQAVKLYTKTTSTCKTRGWLCWWRCCKEYSTQKRMALLADDQCHTFASGSINDRQKYYSRCGVHWRYGDYLK
eukprot:TRINITY_DN717_c0_g1_i2.p1 TRINITY_DN717_c0_g1~~TRINITY_DN717_c0_g1_i2.p1  ORF type:complete len:1317 (+),score=364.94 TRINITY_DN717_c0_g1_i2:128-3952(+)